MKPRSFVVAPKPASALSVENLEIAAKATETPKKEVSEPVETPATQPIVRERFGPSLTSPATPSEPVAKDAETSSAATPSVAPLRSFKTSTSNPTPESARSPLLALSKPKPEPLAFSKPKPEAPAKPQTDFRSALRSRAPPQPKTEGTPEFLSKVGNLRKAKLEHYVAPEPFKQELKVGKTDLAKTGGPVKSVRRDELKESLLAKKDDIKKALEEGRELPGEVHERKTSGGAPITPSKPEALAKRDLLGRAESNKVAASSLEKPKSATPEALARLKSLKQKAESLTPSKKLDAAPLPEPKTTPALDEKTTIPTPHKKTSVPTPEEPKLETLSKQISAPVIGSKDQPTATSRLASRFNPGLANILARGPPAVTTASGPPSRSESPRILEHAISAPSSALSEPASDGAPLQDMRKGRAKGPKKRKGDDAIAAAHATMETPSIGAAPLEQRAPVAVQIKQEEAPKPDSAVPADAAEKLPFKSSRLVAPPGSMASLMKSSLTSSPKPQEPAAEAPKLAASASETRPTATATYARSASPQRPVASTLKARVEQSDMPKPATPAKNARFGPRLPITPIAAPKASVPEFGGFRSAQKPTATPKLEDDKENSDSAPPSVKSVASFWSRPAAAKPAEAPPQLVLPSRRDEEAAMLSAGLLSKSPIRPSSSHGEQRPDQLSTPPASSRYPPRPVKSSRIVSGQLQEASPNRGEPFTYCLLSSKRFLTYCRRLTVVKAQRAHRQDRRQELRLCCQTLSARSRG